MKMKLREKDYQLTVKAFQSPCKIGAALMGWEWGGRKNRQIDYLFKVDFEAKQVFLIQER